MAFFKSWFLIGVFVNVVVQMPGGSPRSSPGVAADKLIKLHKRTYTMKQKYWKSSIITCP